MAKIFDIVVRRRPKRHYALPLVCGVILMLGMVAQASVPVVFLHGWNSDGGIWDDLCYLLSAESGYSHDDFYVWSYYDWLDADGRKFDLDTPIEEIAAEAGRRIAEVAVATGGKVDVVAHSMGGLVVRAALTYGCLSPDVIGHFITLGTPHYGELVGLPYFSNGYQTHEMAFGSSFLWDLAADWHFNGNRIAKTLCIAGVEYSAEDFFDIPTDGLVPACSAALTGCPCIYVKRYHASIFSLFGKVLYQCEDGVDDPVYRAVSAFLSEDRILTQGEVGWRPSDDCFGDGVLFYQVVDAQTGVPRAYGSKTSRIAVVTRTAKKWTLPKAGKLKYVKANARKGIEAGLVVTGENVARLKLTYASKTQTFKGSFKVWTFDEEKKKLKAVSAKVTGVVVNGEGFGEVVVRKTKIGKMVVK